MLQLPSNHTSTRGFFFIASHHASVIVTKTVRVGHHRGETVHLILAVEPGCTALSLTFQTTATPTVQQVTYVVLESQYQSSLTKACQMINEQRDDVCVECVGYLLEELRDPANVAAFKKDVETSNIFIGSLIFVQVHRAPMVDGLPAEIRSNADYCFLKDGRLRLAPCWSWPVAHQLSIVQRSSAGSCRTAACHCLTRDAHVTRSFCAGDARWVLLSPAASESTAFTPSLLWLSLLSSFVTVRSWRKKSRRWWNR